MRKDGRWLSSGTDTWRGNKDLHAGPPAISKFQKHWEVPE